MRNCLTMLVLVQLGVSVRVTRCFTNNKKSVSYA